MNQHPNEVRCTGNPQCRVPHNSWLVESAKLGGQYVPVKGLPVPAGVIVGEMLNGR